MELQVGVKVFLKNDQGKYLLLKRSAKYGKLAGIWDIPGGRIEPETELEENLRREVKEETGLEVNGLIEIVGAQDIFFGEKKKHVVRITYKARTSGEPRLDEESQEYGWFTVEEMKQLASMDPFSQALALKL